MQRLFADCESTHRAEANTQSLSKGAAAVDLMFSLAPAASPSGATLRVLLWLTVDTASRQEEEYPGGEGRGGAQGLEGKLCLTEELEP